MDFKPIFDKAKEFVEFYISVMEELSDKKLKRHRLSLFDFEFTRNHLVYSERGQLYTPIGTLNIPSSCDIITSREREHLRTRLIEKFSLVVIRPGFSVTFNDGQGGSYKYPIYYVPLDPSKPSLELPSPLDVVPYDIMRAYQPRMKVVFREYDTTLFNRYIWIRSGIDFGQLPEEKKPRMRDEFNKWQEEVSKIDDDVPLRKGTKEILQRKFLGD